MDYLKLNLLQNDAERIEARVTNPRQPLWLSKTRTSREEGYHGVEIGDFNMYASKVNYIHFNPVRNGLVEHPEEYLLSSAKDFLNKRKGILKLSFING